VIGGMRWRAAECCDREGARASGDNLTPVQSDHGNLLPENRDRMFLPRAAVTENTSVAPVPFRRGVVRTFRLSRRCCAAMQETRRRRRPQAEHSREMRVTFRLILIFAIAAIALSPFA